MTWAFLLKIRKENYSEALHGESKSYKVVFISLVFLALISGCINKENKQINSVTEGNLGVAPSLEKITPLAAWIYDVQKWDVKANVSAVDGIGVMLKDKPVPIDRPAYEETLYAAFKSEDLSGYDIFTITPGLLSKDSPKIIEVDYIGLKKDGNKTFLELVYKTNKAFDFEIGLGYSQDYDFTGIYPVVSTISDTILLIGARETNDWQSASLEINPAIKDEITKLDLAIGYLEKLDKSWRVGDQKFVWDERKISVDSANRIGESMKSGFGVPKIRLLSYGNVLLEMSYNLPVLQRNTIVVTKDGMRMEGTIAITF